MNHNFVVYYIISLFSQNRLKLHKTTKKTKQNNTKQTKNKTKQNKTKQNKTKTKNKQTNKQKQQNKTKNKTKLTNMLRGKYPKGQSRPEKGYHPTNEKYI